MIRVLQCVNNMHRAGLETILMNYYRHIDRDRIQFDFLTHRPFRSEYDDEIESLGGKVYYAPRLYPQNYPAYFRYMKGFFKEHPEYQIIHSHIDAMSYLPLLAAKKAGVPVRIAHSHNTSIDKDFKYLIKQYFRRRLPGVATDFFACGQEAGRYLFGNRQFRIIPNAIDPKLFCYDQDVRDRTRKNLGIEDEFVIGYVGRLTRQKNVQYLIRVFQEICNRTTDCLLLIIGAGEEEKELKELADSTGYGDKIRFLGVRSDVSNIYQALDLFAMPSLYEGLPVVGVEAQFSGLQCIFSSTITREIQLTEKAHFLNINRKPEDWAKYILQIRREENNRTIIPEYSAFNIESAVKILENYYINTNELLVHDLIKSI